MRRVKRLPKDKLETLAREAILRLANRSNVGAAACPEARSQFDLDRFCTALMDKDDAAAFEMVVELSNAQVPPDQIYLNHLAPAARKLGDWWNEDRVSFWEVTVGTCRLLAIMRSMAHLFEPKAEQSDRSALFASVPGEQHTVGLQMAADLFREDGWRIWVFVGLDHDGLMARIEDTQANIIGLSLSGSHALDALSKLVVSIHVSRPDLPIVLNGQGIEEIAPKLTWMELDGVASHVDEAKEVMTSILAAKAGLQRSLARVPDTDLR